MATPDDRRQRPLDRQRFDLEVLGPVDAEQHDHEQEQHDDRPGVDDHLHGGEEVRLHGDEVHGDAEQREHEAERGVHRAAAHDDADRPGEHHQRRGDEDEQLQELRALLAVSRRGVASSSAGSGGRTP